MVRPSAITIVLIVAALGACGYPQPRRHTNHDLPLRAARVQELNTGDAVVSYLRQRDADPSVCNPAATGPHVTLGSPREMEDLVDGIGRGARPMKWAECVLELLGKVDDTLAAALLDRVLYQYSERVAYARLDADPEVNQQLEILRRVYAERPPDRNPSLDGRFATISRLEQLDDSELTAFGRAGRDAALTALYLEQGQLRDGRPVTVENLDALFQQGAIEELRLYSRRIPNSELRSEAARRLVRLRIARSPFTELRADPATASAVEERVMSLGRNPVSLAANTPTEVVFDSAALPARGISIHQDVLRQQARLSSWREHRENLSVVPPVDLRPVLSFTVPGFSAPLRLCDAPEELRPDPCVDPRELSLGLPFATLEADGEFRIAERLDAASVVAIARRGPGFRIPIELHGEPLVDAVWDIDFSTAGPAYLSPGYGQPGPEVHLTVDATNPETQIYEIESGSLGLLAVIEREDVGRFGVYAAGGDGQPGQRGYDGQDGSDGSDGQDASCPSSAATNGGNGTAGQDGGPGGPGGDGGPGGRLLAKLECPASECAALAQALQATIGAPGGRPGPGGAGGRGGDGGDGGEGGDSTTCTDNDGNSTTLSGGSDGSDGADGRDGPRGPDGLAGPPGQLALTVDRQGT